MVETDRPPEPFPEPEAEIGQILDVPGRRGAGAVAETLARSPWVYEKVTVDEESGRVLFLYLPTAELVTLDASGAGAPQIAHRCHWSQSPDRFRFVERPLRIVVATKRAGARRALLLSDGPRAEPGSAGDWAGLVESRLSRQHEVCRVKGKLRGVVHARANIDRVVETTRGGTVLMSLAARDARIAPSSGRPAMPPAEYAEHLAAIASSLAAADIAIGWFDPVPTGCAEADRHLREFADLGAEVMTRHGAALLRCWDELAGRDDLGDPDGTVLSPAGTALLAERLAGLAERLESLAARPDR
jgi:hypothetical protein